MPPAELARLVRAVDRRSRSLPGPGEGHDRFTWNINGVVLVCRWIFGGDGIGIHRLTKTGVLGWVQQPLDGSA